MPSPLPQPAPGTLRRIAALAALFAAACSTRPDDLADGVLWLPDGLREVSGIVALDERTLVGVQDEAGALYFVDLRGERPVRRVPFGKHGDYEGLACVGDTWWVLRSDGVLEQVVPHGKGLKVAASHRLVTGHQEYEGLCHDAANGMLLVLPKDKVGDAKAERSQRCVYGFDLATATLRAEPVVVFRVDELVREAEALGLPLPTKITAKGKVRVDLQLRCSEILCVPGSTDLLLLSSLDHLLVRIDRQGHPRAIVPLDPALLVQPEGMAFLPDGRLLVASEGRDGPACVRVVAL